MTLAELIAEGRRLARPCVLLRPDGVGPPAAFWYGRDAEEIEATGFRRWIAVETRFVPGISAGLEPFFTVWTDEKRCRGGRICFHPFRPGRIGMPLYPTTESVLPPLDAVFARGSDAVGAWLAKQDWTRDDHYNDNFPERATAEQYERLYQRESPPYRRDSIYAVLGGWHAPLFDDDWHDLIDDRLLVQTFEDAEPWVESWRLRTGELRVVARIS